MFRHIGGHFWFHRTTIARYWIRDSTSLEDEKRNVTPVRWVIESVSGFIANFHGYQGDDEPLRLQPVHQAHSTKETLDLAIFVVHNTSVVWVLGHRTRG